MSVFDEVNALSAEAVLNRINLPLARDGKSYICPLCENGATGDPRHGHGDGIKPRNSKGRVRWKCHKCGVDFSNFDLVAATLGLDAERDAGESARRLGELFGFSGESNTPFLFSRGEGFSHFSVADRQASSDSRTSEPVPPKNYVKFYEVNRANVAKFLAEQGGTWRGLTLETFEKYGLALHPEFGLEGHEKSLHLIIPYDDYHFTARAIEGHDRSQHGTNSGLYEPLPINTDEPYSVNFIVEGEIDALSIAQVISGFEIVGCVATGGATKYRKVVPELEKRFGNSERKPSFIVMFDNDTAGKTNGLKLVNEIRRI